MRKKRRGIDRFFFKGPLLCCPDCGEESIFGGGSLLGDLSSEIAIDPQVLSRLYEDCFSNAKLETMCSECTVDEDNIILWIELENGALRGPLCTACFYHYTTEEYGGDLNALDDTRVYFIRINTRTQAAIYELAAALAEEGDEDQGQRETFPELSERDLF